MLKYNFQSQITALVAVVVLSATLSARANSVEFDYNNAFSGTAPDGAAPWLTATFTDTSADTVTLTMSGAGLTGSEFVKGWYFNINNVAASSLTITELAQTGTFQVPSVSQNTDSYKADGSGKYDILFCFATANNPPSPRFMAGDSITFTITAAGLDALDFDALCTASAGMGPFYSAAQVCAIPSNGQSGWVNPTTADVPDVTATILLLGIGMLIIEGARRRFLPMKNAATVSIYQRQNI